MHESFVCDELLVAVPDTVHAHFPLHHERYGKLRQPQQQSQLCCCCTVFVKYMCCVQLSSVQYSVVNNNVINATEFYTHLP